MIDALITGKLIKEPSLKTSQNGNEYCNFILAVPTGEELPTIVSGIAFGDPAQRIAKLAKGDAVSLTGSLKLSSWTDKATGETKAGINVTVSDVLTAYDIKKRRAASEAQDKPTPSPKAKHYAAKANGYAPEARPFNDDISF